MNNKKIKNTYLDYLYNYEYLFHYNFLYFYGFRDTESISIRTLSLFGYFLLSGNILKISKKSITCA